MYTTSAYKNAAFDIGEKRCHFQSTPGAQSKVSTYTMFVPMGENVTLFSETEKKLTLFYDAVNKAWSMPAPQNQCVFVSFWGGNNKTLTGI